MLPYWIIFLFFLVLSLLDFFGLKFNREAKSVLLLGGALILTLFSGLRFECDNDYVTYVHVYESAPDLVAILQGKAQLSDVYGEFLFGALCIIFKTLNAPPFVLFLTIAWLTFYCLYRVILKFSFSPFASLLLYVSMYYLAGGFTQIRFGLATTMAWLAITCLYEGNTRRYILLLSAASLFHVSALVALLVYVFKSVALTGPRVYFFVLAACVISSLDLSGLMVNVLVSAVSGLRYITYFGDSGLLSKANSFSILLYGLVTIVFWHCRKYYEEKLFFFLLKIAIICLLSGAFFIQLYILSRVALLLQMVFIFILPMVICTPRNRYYFYALIWCYAIFRYQQFFTVVPELRFIQEYQNVLFYNLR